MGLSAKQQRLGCLRALLILLLLFPVSKVFANSGITYHGRLLDPNGLPVTSSNVQFKMQIRTPGTQDCLMYEEIQTLDLSTTSGMFALSIGDGTGVRQDSYSWSLFDALSNRKDFSFNAGDCTGVNTYSPDVADNRKFRVYFNDGTFPAGTWEALPLQTINFIPMSIETYAVGGFPASSLLRVETAGTLGTTTPLTSTQYSEILALVNGTSSQYEKDGELNGSSLPTISSGESVRWTGSAWQAFTPLTSETDPNVEAFAKSSLPTCATGEVLKSDGTSLSCVTDAGGWSAVDATTTVKGIVNVPVAGGLEVTSGAIGLPDVVTGGTYTKVTVDAKGRVTTGANITGSDITSGTIGGSTSISTTGSVSSASLSTRQIDLYDSDNTHHISFLTPATGSLTTNYDLVFPSTLGTSNQILGMNNAGDALENKSITAGSGVTITHSAGGIAIAATGSGGTVTSVTGTSPISVATGTTTPVISLDDAGTAGTYGSSTEVPVFTTDSKGRVTSVTETTISGVSPVGSTLATGQAWIGDGSGEAQARFIGFSDLKTSIAGNANQIPTTCSSSQVMTYSAVTDVFSCTSISITASQVSDLDVSDYVEIAGDTMTGALNLPSNGLVVGTDELVVSSGKVGIGTDTPGSQFTVAGDAATTEMGIFYSSNPSTALSSKMGTILRISNTSTADNKAGLRISKANSGGTGNSYGDFRINQAGDLEWAVGITDSTTDIPEMVLTAGGSVGIGTINPSSKLDVSGTIQIANGGETCSAVADGGMIRYNGGNLQFCNESAWQTLGVSGAGLTSLNGQTGSTQSFATPGTSGTAPNWSSATNAHTLNIPMASTASVTAGLISKAQYDDFDSRLDPANNLSDLANAGTARTNLGLGSAAVEDVGTSAGNVVQLDAGAKIPASLLPALDGGDIANTPTGDIAATTVQAAIDELDSEKVSIAGDTMTGTLNLPSNGLVVGTDQLIVSSGNVGVGTATPTSKLNISNAVTGALNYQLKIENLASAANDTSGIAFKVATGTGDIAHKGGLVFARQTSNGRGNLHFLLNDTDDTSNAALADAKMTILRGGNVGIGTTVPGSLLTLSISNAPNQTQKVEFQRSNNTTAGGLTSRSDGSGVFRVSLDDQTGAETLAVVSSNVGIGTTTPSSKLDVAGTIQIANGGETCSAAADGGMIRYNGGNLQFCNESSWQTLGVSGGGLTSLNSQTGSTQTFATPGTSGTAPNWSSASDAHTLNIPMASTTSVTAGLISKTDYDAFNAKLDSVAGETLSSGQVWVGDGSNVAAQRYFGVEDLKTALGAQQIPTACTSKQTMIWSAVTDVFSCTDISITASQISDLDLTDYVEVAGDTMTGTLTLPSSGLAVGANQLVVSGGNVGIGTASPLGILDIYGTAPHYNIRTPGTDIWSQATINLVTKDDASAKLGASANNLGWSIYGRGNAYTTTSQQNDFGIGYWNGTSWLTSITIDSTTGSVGIGIANPQTTLHVGTGTNISATDSTTGFVISGSATSTNIGIDNNEIQARNNTAASTLHLNYKGGDIAFGNASQMHLESSTGHLGIGTVSPARLLHVDGAMRMTASTTPSSPAAGDMFIDSADSNKLKYYNGSSWVEAGGSGGIVTSVTGTSPISVDNTDPAAPVISISDTGTAGTYGSATEVPVFTTDAKGRVTSVTETTISGVSPVGSTLSTGEVWVGDGSNDAQERFLGVEDLKTSVGVAQIPLTCTAAQTMTWSAVTDVFSCTNISVTASQISDLDMADYVEIAGDTMTGALNLPSNGLVVGTDELIVSGGNVGIGTTNPSGLLHTLGTGVVKLERTAASSTGVLTPIYSTRSNSAGTGADGIGSGINFIIETETEGVMESPAYISAVAIDAAAGAVDGELNFHTSKDGTQSAKMTINGDGNVGVGTTNPARLLHVNGPMRMTASTAPSSPVAGDVFIDSADSNTLKWYNGSSWQSPTGGNADIPVRFTRTSLNITATDSAKDAQCVSEFGSNYQAGRHGDIAAAWPGSGASDMEFTVYGETASLYCMNNNSGGILINTGTCGGTSGPVACVSISTPIRFTRTSLNITATDSAKDAQCVSEFGSNYQAGRHGDIAAAWPGSGASDMEFTVYGETASLYCMNNNSGGIDINTGLCGGSSGPVACLLK